jgi:DNA-binding HxlR family transcriptional regulator
MQNTPFGNMRCPLARSLSRVGDWWNILILREAFYGSTRFDQLQQRLGIATNTLTRRLNTMVEQGLLERRRYSERPPRDEYILTDLGRDFRPVLVALYAWGNKNFTPEGKWAELADAATGRPIDPVVIDRNTGAPLPDRLDIVPGPAADEHFYRRFSDKTSL